MHAFTIRRPLFAVALAVATIALTWSARPAFADDAASVVVLGDEPLRTPLETALQTWLHEHGHILSTATLPAKTAQLVHDCLTVDDEACARRVVDGAHLPGALVLVSVELATTADGSRDATLVGYWFPRGATPVAERRFCERCSDQGVRGVAADLMTALASARTRGTGRLELTSTPPGARVLLDGQPIGVTPLSYDAAPGNHVIALEGDRHEVITRDIVVRDGQATVLDVPLAAPATATPPPAGRSRALPIALLAGGGALLVTGGVLFAIDEDASLAQRYYTDTAPAGVALGAAGGVALAVGAYLLLRSPSDAAPTVAVTHDGVSLGWAGAF